LLISIKINYHSIVNNFDQNFPILNYWFDYWHDTDAQL